MKNIKEEVKKLEEILKENPKLFGYIEGRLDEKIEFMGKIIKKEV
ncbi:hypothetical protein AB8L61_19360 [Clostridioides difficile]